MQKIILKKKYTKSQIYPSILGAKICPFVISDHSTSYLQQIVSRFSYFEMNLYLKMKIHQMWLQWSPTSTFKNNY